MKLFKFGTALQIIYCFCCLIVVICMSLFATFYTSTFGLICFRIGEILTLISTFNPIGVVGTVINIIACCTTDIRNQKSCLVWTIVSSILVVFFWLLAVYFFVHNSGGV